MSASDFKRLAGLTNLYESWTVDEADEVLEDDLAALKLKVERIMFVESLEAAGLSTITLESIDWGSIVEELDAAIMGEADMNLAANRARAMMLSRETWKGKHASDKDKHDAHKNAQQMHQDLARRFSKESGTAAHPHVKERLAQLGKEHERMANSHHNHAEVLSHKVKVTSDKVDSQGNHYKKLGKEAGATDKNKNWRQHQGVDTPKKSEPKSEPKASAAHDSEAAKSTNKKPETAKPATKPISKAVSVAKAKSDDKAPETQRSPGNAKPEEPKARSMKLLPAKGGSSAPKSDKPKSDKKVPSKKAKKLRSKMASNAKGKKAS